MLGANMPDPIIVARRYKDEKIALVCALFGYGNAKQILKFLESIDFGLLQKPKRVKNLYYRFQKSEDVYQLFFTLSRIDSLQEAFMRGYKESGDILQGVRTIQEELYALSSYRSYGYNFLLGKPLGKDPHKLGTYKRWLMFLRWMVRDDGIDLGLWRGVKKSDLILPLDTHTFRTTQKLGLLKRKSYDMQAALEVTHNLRRYDADDPVKYDIALYRLGQLKLI